MLIFLESECTNHGAGSTYTSDLLYEVQDEEPSSSPTLVPPTIQPLATPELKPLPTVGSSGLKIIKKGGLN